MAGDFLKRNRHGTQFYFRRRVPDDLRVIVGQAYLIQSLRTGLRSVATSMARLLAAKSDILFDQLRTMSDSASKSQEARDPTANLTPEQKAGREERIAEMALKWRHKQAQIERLEQLEEELAEVRSESQRKLDAMRSKSREVALRAVILGIERGYKASSNNRSEVVGDQGSGVEGNKGKLSTDKTVMQVWEEFKAERIAIGAQDDVKGGWSNPGRVDVEQLRCPRI